MALQSKLFANDTKLSACSQNNSAHVMQGASGEHVAKLQTALRILDDAAIDDAEVATKKFGASTAKAVLRYKTRNAIINRSYQSQPDAIVGKMTIAKLDADMVDWERRRDPNDDDVTALISAIDNAALYLSLRPGSQCMARFIRALKMAVLQPDSNRNEVGAAPAIAAGAVLVLLLVLIMALVWLQISAAQRGDQGAVQRLGREIDERIARFGWKLKQLEMEGGIALAMAVAQLIRATERAIDNANKDIDDCAKKVRDPKRIAECLDKKTTAKRVVKKLEMFFRLLTSPNRTPSWTQDAERQFTTLCEELFEAIFQFKSCMNCLD